MARKCLQYNVRMTKTQLILNRYKPLAKAGVGGFGTVQVAWDTRIQRKVAIKCIPLSEAELLRAALPGADALDISPDERGESSAGSQSFGLTGAHAAGSAASSATAIDPADVPPWEDLPEEAGFAGVEDAGVPDGPDASAKPTSAPAREVGPGFAGFDPADPSSADSFPNQLLPGQSVSLTNAVDPASRPLVRTLSRIPGLDEARTAAMLSDPSIVAVYDFEIQDSTAYLIMEYVEGMTLTELLRDHDDRLTLDVVAAVFEAVAHALEVAHENGVLHLDIKPDNILINASGQVKVTDFGLATLADAQGFGVAGGGTIGYMPLEQMRQENLDARCDEWALASVTYEMLAGENPFLAPNLFQAQEAIEDGELVLPSLCWDNLDSAADDPIFYALDPEREERYESVADFAEELSPFLGDPAKGRAELADIVAGPDEEEETEPQPREPGIPLRDRITPELVFFGSHACGAAGSALLAFLSLQNISQTEGFANPLFWGLLLLITLAGALRPHLGHAGDVRRARCGMRAAGGCRRMVVVPGPCGRRHRERRAGDAACRRDRVGAARPSGGGFCAAPGCGDGDRGVPSVMRVHAGRLGKCLVHGVGYACHLAFLGGGVRKRCGDRPDGGHAVGTGHVDHDGELGACGGCVRPAALAPHAAVRVLRRAGGLGGAGGRVRFGGDLRGPFRIRLHRPCRCGFVGRFLGRYAVRRLSSARPRVL